MCVISNICASRVSVINDDDLNAAVRSAEKDKEREGKVWRHFCKKVSSHRPIIF
jgi:hypothetical protein